MVYQNGIRSVEWMVRKNLCGDIELVQKKSKKICKDYGIKQNGVDEKRTRYVSGKEYMILPEGTKMKL